MRSLGVARRLGATATSPRDRKSAAFLGQGRSSIVPSRFTIWCATRSTQLTRLSRSSFPKKPSWFPVHARCRIPRAQNGDSRCKPRSSSSTATRRRKRACSSKTSCVSVSLRQHFFKKLQRSRIVGLPQPEHGLLSHGGIPIRLRHFDQFGHAFVLGQLA